MLSAECGAPDRPARQATISSNSYSVDASVCNAELVSSLGVGARLFYNLASHKAVGAIEAKCIEAKPQTCSSDYFAALRSSTRSGTFTHLALPVSTYLLLICLKRLSITVASGV